MASPASQIPLVHTVYFALEDRSPAAKQELIAACKKLLADHPGTVFFAVGPLAEEIQWSVSDRDFDVAICIVFASKAAHDHYQDSPAHQRFIEENSGNWKQIRCFDFHAEG